MSDDKTVVRLVSNNNLIRTKAIDSLESALKVAREEPDLNEAVLVLFSDRGEDGIKMKRFSTDASLITQRIVLECETNQVQSMMYDPEDTGD